MKVQLKLRRFNPETDTCPITPACKLSGLLGEALGAFLSVLDSYTLADLVEQEDRKALNKLLGRPIEPEIQTGVV